MVKKTTSLKVDENLWKEVKIHCIKKDIEISKYIEDLFKKDLKKKGKNKWKKREQKKTHYIIKEFHT